MEWIIPILVISGFIGAGIGATKGMTGLGFLLGAILGPFGIFAMAMFDGNRLRCPYCMKMIHKDAERCPYCQGEFAD